MRRGTRGAGIAVDPDRIREARIEAGLSLAQIAGDQVSRTFIHFVETGQSRPSQRVLALIARRTRKPVRYFILDTTLGGESSQDLATDLSRVATRVQKFAAGDRLTEVEVKAMKLVELTLRQAADLTRSVQSETIADRQKR